jgi:hypothetical protein
MERDERLEQLVENMEGFGQPFHGGSRAAVANEAILQFVNFMMDRHKEEFTDYLKKERIKHSLKGENHE